MSEPAFRDGEGRQAAALCWRRTPALEILLITSLTRQRWILPKGWIELEQSAAQTAAREAFEEAGMLGTVAAQPVAHYQYLKEKRDGAILCHVAVYGLAVTEQAQTWPEMARRQQAWLAPEAAASRVTEPDLRAILLAFAPPEG